MADVTARGRVVSGMRPTGKLHQGHLVGALGNWVELQAQYDCFYFVADWHALTSGYADTSELTAYARDNAADWIAAGIDPERSTLFVQSLVPEHAELSLLLSMIIPIPWLERVPTYKEQIDQLSDTDLSSVGFLSYPLLQTADIVMYNAKYVPVGEEKEAVVLRLQIDPVAQRADEVPQVKLPRGTHPRHDAGAGGHRSHDRINCAGGPTIAPSIPVNISAYNRRNPQGRNRSY
jgi:tryptophanyl-tRNA synthetase